MCDHWCWLILQKAASGRKTKNHGWYCLYEGRLRTQSVKCCRGNDLVIPSWAGLQTSIKIFIWTSRLFCQCWQEREGKGEGRGRERLPCFRSLLALIEGVPPSGHSVSIAASGQRKEGTHSRVWGIRKGYLIQENFSPRKNSGQAVNQTAYLILMVDDVDLRQKSLWTS